MVFKDMEGVHTETFFLKVRPLQGRAGSQEARFLISDGGKVTGRERVLRRRRQGSPLEGVAMVEEV